MLGDACLLSEKAHLLFRLQMSMRVITTLGIYTELESESSCIKTLPKPVVTLAVLMSIGLCGEVKLTARVTKSFLNCCI